MHLEIKESSTNMKLRVLNIIVSLFITACTISSCLDSDVVEFEYSSNASITAFSITDSIVTRYPAVVNGKDTTLSKSVVGSNYPFIINQSEGLIYNPDSLPVGTDISKVVVDITADTQGIYIVAETDSIWEETDSLNFEKPIQFKVLAEIGSFGRAYTAKINVHQQEPDSLNWTKMDANFPKTIQKQKAVYANNGIYVFAEGNGQVVMTETTDGKNWSEPTSIDIPTQADYSSVMACGNQFYILADNELYTSTNGLQWTKVESTQKIARLLANIHTEHNHKFIGVDSENYYIESEDGIVWSRHETMPAEFPVNQTSFVSYALDTNEQLERIVLIGDNGIATDTITNVWTTLNTETSWTELLIEDPDYACPKLNNSQLIQYNDQLYLFGGPGQHNGKLQAFERIYASKDNGISWEAITKKVMFPQEFNTLYEKAGGNYSCVVDDQQFIWIMWSQTGEVWRGRINKFGFERQ